MNFLLAQAAAASAFSVDNVTITLVTGMLVTVISAIAGGIVTVITALRMNQVAARQVENANAIQSVAKDTEAIKGHVNSEKTEGAGREITLRRENELLRQMLADQKTTASLLAQAVVGRSREIATPPVAVVPIDHTLPSTIEKIEENTAATAVGVEKLTREKKNE